MQVSLRKTRVEKGRINERNGFAHSVFLEPFRLGKQVIREHYKQTYNQIESKCGNLCENASNIEPQTMPIIENPLPKLISNMEGENHANIVFFRKGKA